MKYQLVEAADRGKTLPCLICKRPIKVPAENAAPPPLAKSVRIAGPKSNDGVNLDG